MDGTRMSCRWRVASSRFDRRICDGPFSNRVVVPIFVVVVDVDVDVLSVDHGRWVCRVCCCCGCCG